jgi:hypothetical protein
MVGGRKLLILIITAILSVYIFELYLFFKNKQIDTRTKTEVLDDFKELGVKAYHSYVPLYFPEELWQVPTKVKVYPLGGISNVTTVFCKEGGAWSIYESDEHGFNNPKGLYNDETVDIVLTGDSYTEGACVEHDETISHILRSNGFNSISIGKGGNGPLTELAALKEYALTLKPAVVLWLYSLDDLPKIQFMIQRPILKQYLFNNKFSQNLLERQGEIDAFLIDFIEQKKKDSVINNQPIQKNTYKIYSFIQLKHLREKLREKLRQNEVKKVDPLFQHPVSDKIISIFKEVMKNAKKMVSGWGGRIYFVYLPPSSLYFDRIDDLNRKAVLNVIDELGITLIDIHEEVFINHPEPKSLWQGHFNAEGYRLVAEAISMRLTVDGYRE